MLFQNLKLIKQLQKSLYETNYINCTKVQEKTIPLILDGFDVKAKANTGSGKTASFVLPILQKLYTNKQAKKRVVKALVLVPTRELSLQVEQNIKKFSKYFEKEIKSVNLIGGLSIGDQLLEVQKGCDIVVATPGRLLDIISKKQISLQSLEFFVLDEADKLMNEGFEEELDEILKHLNKNRQNLFFSATYNEKIEKTLNKISKEYKEISLEDEKKFFIKQRAIKVNKENRSALLKKLLKDNSWEKVIVFMANKRACDNIAAKFRKNKIEAESFHGDLEQKERIATLDDFKENLIQVLFCTDIAARGLHIEGVSCVVNFDPPRSTSDYTHRIGRSGRNGKEGLAISFIDYESMEHFALIEKRVGIKLELEEMEGFELKGEKPLKKKGPAPIKGKRKSKKDKLREAALKKQN